MLKYNCNKKYICKEVIPLNFLCIQDTYKSMRFISNRSDELNFSRTEGYIYD
jgi:hypothetical protein